MAEAMFRGHSHLSLRLVPGRRPPDTEASMMRLASMIVVMSACIGLMWSGYERTPSWAERPGRTLLADHKCLPTDQKVCFGTFANNCVLTPITVGCAGVSCGYTCLGITLYTCQSFPTESCTVLNQKNCPFQSNPMCIAPGATACTCDPEMLQSNSCGAPYGPTCNT